ncbi:MAG: MBOAT family protein, partial [Ruminococcus sp.]|nr:MBOAT family protein [Ruminococcus sp.]
SAPLAWLGAFSYMMQIFFDFSGYSDMAIGLGKMFGFDFRENFNYPYISESMQEFWRRWHISVSTWFKEYLYIPLGGNRKGKVRTAFNKLFVFFCTGLWHGASLNFIVWGLINGAFMMLESYKIVNTEKWLKPFRHIYTLLVTLLAFVFFRADDISTACVYIGKMFSFSGSSPENNSLFMMQFTPMYIIMAFLACIFSVPVWQIVRNKINSEKIISAGEICSYVVSLLMLMLCILTLSSASYNPFIYFRF